jgi:hypothetical protein
MMGREGAKLELEIGSDAKAWQISISTGTIEHRALSQISRGPANSMSMVADLSRQLRALQ